jgi:parallel beta-helix repeat protein
VPFNVEATDVRLLKVSDGQLPPDTVYVDDDFNETTPGWGYDHFDKIQKGIDAVVENGAVYVFNGTYYEQVTINKKIDLVGEDKNDTVIDAGGSGSVVSIYADQVSISGFTMQNSGTVYGDSGVKIFSNHNFISNNTLGGDNNYGLRLEISNDNTISNNIITSNRDNGIDLYTSCNNTISNNKIILNVFGGLELHHYSHDNNISGRNIIERNGDDGIRIRHGNNNNSIIGNYIISNGAGIGFIYNSDKNNLIYHNNFINNTQNAYGDGPNMWDNGYPTGGNYWDDYTGIDNFSGPNQNEEGPDGIGDTPYNITGGSMQDHYPFMNENGWINSPPETPEQPTGPQSGFTYQFYTYCTSTIDLEGNDVFYLWDWGDGSFSNWLGPYESDESACATNSWPIGGIYQIRVKAKDVYGSESDWSEPLTVTIWLACLPEVATHIPYHRR